MLVIVLAVVLLIHYIAPFVVVYFGFLCVNMRLYCVCITVLTCMHPCTLKRVGKTTTTSCCTRRAWPSSLPPPLTPARPMVYIAPVIASHSLIALKRPSHCIAWRLLGLVGTFFDGSGMLPIFAAHRGVPIASNVVTKSVLECIVLHSVPHIV
jgi:hypothetical protein